MATLQELISSTKNNLKPTHTVITQKDGSRYLEQKDGSLAPLPSESVDEDGAYAILDEAGALGLSGEEPPSSASADSKNPRRFESAAMLQVVKEYTSVLPYLRLLKMGAPLNQVRIRISMDTLNKRITEEAGAAFLEVVEVDDGGSAQPQASSERHFAHFSEAHGHFGDTSWDLPKIAVHCETDARAGYNTAKSHEYLDSPEVLKAKVQLLAQLLTAAHRPVFYAGAGLSTASGVGDYATQSGSAGLVAKANKRTEGEGQDDEPSAYGRRRISPFCARPNLGHRTIAALGNTGHCFRFIQQNHDGLPQKAGMAQHLLNEIHGAWFDPSNPVVAMSGNLRGDLFDDLLECERQTDCVVAVGSSLCGMNADRLVVTSALRSRENRERLRSKGGEGVIPEGMTAFGSVIVSIQKTVHDHNSSLRIFALIDDVMALLAEEMALEVPPANISIGNAEEVFSVPYDASGERIGDGSSATTTLLDLREGAELVVASGPDKGAKATVLGRNADGHFRIAVQRSFKRGDRKSVV